MINYLSLFSGIGAFESAMRNLDIPFEITNYCEIGEPQSKAYSMIHGIDEKKNLHDITTVDETKLGEVDFITYGFPCQDIAQCGLQKGFIDEEGWEYIDPTDERSLDEYKEEVVNTFKKDNLDISSKDFRLIIGSHFS